MTSAKRRRRDHNNRAVNDVEGKTITELLQHRHQNLMMLLSLMNIVVMVGSYMLLLLRDKYEKCNEMRRRALSRDPKLYARHSWKKEQARFSGRMFYRLFRMKKPCFDNLCDKIKSKVGDDVFKSDEYLADIDNEGITTWRGRIHQARKMTVGAPISGEWKLAISLRMMAGATYLDMYLWSNVSTPWVISLFNTVVSEWICETLVINLFDNIIGNETEIENITKNFAMTSDGYITGCMGALDGWMVTIRCPTLTEVPNPGKYFCRKGFYALNVQVIVDKDKRILWRSIGCIGSCHDSRAFNESKLATYLTEHAHEFMQKGLFFVGDSAYALRPYLLTPFDNAPPNSDKDMFNYYLSKNRIFVECAFGEIDRRWGILWRPLEGSLTRKTSIIDAALKLHNFIVDFRMKEKNENDTLDEDEELEVTRRNYRIQNASDARGLYMEEEILQATVKRGRPSNNEVELRHLGNVLRERLRDRLWNAGLRRC